MLQRQQDDARARAIAQMGSPSMSGGALSSVRPDLISQGIMGGTLAGAGAIAGVTTPLIKGLATGMLKGSFHPASLTAGAGLGALTSPDDRLAGAAEGAAYMASPVAASLLSSGEAQAGPLSKLFYSALVRGIEKAPAKVSDYAQWIAKNSGPLGIKKQEIEWTGLPEYLAANQKATKDDLLDFLRKSQVQVKDVQLSDEAPVASQERKQLERHWADIQARDAQLRQDRPSATSDEVNDIDKQRAILSIQSTGIRKQIEALPDAPKPTKFSSYQLHGGENYREMLLTMPYNKEHGTESLGKDGEYETFVDGQFHDRSATETAARSSMEAMQNNPANAGHTFEIRPTRQWNDIEKPLFQSTHFDQPNILAHIRMNDRTDAEGKKVLFLEELQSDWGQKGKKEGFQGSTEPQHVAYYMTPDGKRVDVGYGKTQDEALHAAGDWPTVLNNAGMKLETEVQQIPADKVQVVPNAPFVQDTKAWTALALKHAIAHAIDNGYDRVAWTNGEQQAARYDLSKQVDGIDYAKSGDGTYTLKVKLAGNGGYHSLNNLDAKGLEDNVGKEVAYKIINNEGREVGAPEGSGLLSGLDLKVGGEGMKGYYDQIVPQVANDVLKKVGGDRVGEVRFADFGSEQGAKDDALLSDLGIGVEGNRPPSQPGFDITDAMRAKVQSEGIPLFTAAPIGAGIGAMQADDPQVSPDIPDAPVPSIDAEHSTPSMARGGIVEAQPIHPGPTSSGPRGLTADDFGDQLRALLHPDTQPTNAEDFGEHLRRLFA